MPEGLQMQQQQVVSVAKHIQVRAVSDFDIDVVFGWLTNIHTHHKQVIKTFIVHANGAEQHV